MHTSDPAQRMSTWRTLFESGPAADAASANPIQQRALLVNKLAIVLALLSNLTIMGSFFVIGDTVPVRALLLLTLSSVLYVACFILLHRGMAALSGITFSVSLLATALFLTLSLGTDAQPHLLCLPIALGGTIIWPRSALGMTLHGLGCTVLYFGLEGWGPPVSVAGLSVSDDITTLMTYFYTALTVGLCGTILLLNSFTSIRLQNLLDAERSKVEKLLLQILPVSVARELLSAGRYTPRRVAEVTVLFGDIVGFTSMSESYSPETIVAMLNDLFSTFDKLVETHGVEKIKTIGDAYMVISGAPNHREDHLEAMASLALAMLESANKQTLPDGTPIQMRIGIDTGSAVAGVVGDSRSIYDIWGATVNMASRMESHGEAGKIHVTSRVQQRLATTHHLASRGQTMVKNIGMVETFWLEAGTP